MIGPKGRSILLTIWVARDFSKAAAYQAEAKEAKMGKASKPSRFMFVIVNGKQNKAEKH